MDQSVFLTLVVLSLTTYLQFAKNDFINELLTVLASILTVLASIYMPIFGST